MRKGEGWRGEKGGGIGMGRDGERGRDMEGWRKGEGWWGDGVVWSEGGGAETDLGLSLPVSIHGHWPSFLSHGSHFGWWWFVCIMVGR